MNPQPTQTTFFLEHDASVDAVSLNRTQCLNYGWTITVCKTGTDGDGKVIIEASQDGVKWFPYIDKEICTEDGVIQNSEILLNEDDFMITDEFFHAYHIRLRYLANGTTTGLINAVLKEKIRS